MRDNIILIGFMGAGKSTVGKQLAKRLGFRFMDTDEAIEKKAGKRISEIFAEEGEKSFRKKEGELLSELLAKTEKTVISTGGGLPMEEKNGRYLRELGFVVYLDVTKETVLERLKKDTRRPLLQGEDKEKRVEELLSFRQPIYEYTAHITIDTNQRNFDEIIDDIVRNYEIMMAREKEKKENENNESKRENE